MNITAYALSIFAVIVISAVADIMLPDGKTSKTAKAVFSVMITLTLLSPGIKLIRGDLNIEDITAKAFETDNELISHTFYMIKTGYEEEIYVLLSDNGYDFVTSVECDVGEENRRLEKVKIFYDNVGINKEDEHTYISGMKTVVKNAYEIREEAITVSGG